MQTGQRPRRAGSYATTELPVESTPSTPVNSSQSGSWGLPEAAVGWFTAQFVGFGAFAVVAGLGFDLIRPQRPGGFLGRAVGQSRSGEFVDNSLPLAWQMLLQVPGWIVMLGLAWLLAGLAGKARPGWSLRGTFSDVGTGAVAGFFLQFPVVVIVINLIVLIFGEITPTGRPLSLVDSIDTPVDLVALFAVVVVGAPVVEEVFYRGLIQRSLVERFGPYVGIGVASLIFGAVHFAWVDLLPLTVVGAGFGILAHRSGRLLPAIVAHMVFNAITLVALLSSTS